jgi:Cys-rich repeat protein
MNRLPLTRPKIACSAAQHASRLAAAAVLFGPTVLTLHCSMEDTGSIAFVTRDSTKGPKKPPKPCAGDGECTPPTPYCDLASATCIECLADPNCAGPKRFCGPLGACVECLTDTGCAKGKPYCDMERYVCAECLLDAQCDAAKVCDATDHRCVPSCVDSSTCEAMKPYCDSARRFCVECLTDVNCADPKKPACGSSGCVECTTAAHCPADKPLCDVATSKCVGCNTDLDCPAGRHCDPMQHCAP